MIVMDESGNSIDYFQERNDTIKKNLQPILDEFVEREKKYLSAKKYINLGYSFLQQVVFEFMKQPPLTPEQIEMIDADMLWDIWYHYYDLLRYYNRFFEIVHNKQIFCLYCGINDEVFLSWQNSTDEKIRNLIGNINTNYLGNGWVASESGNAPQSAIKERVRAKGVGHDVVSASEDLFASKMKPEETPEEIMKRIKEITGNEIPLLGDKK